MVLTGKEKRAFYKYVEECEQEVKLGDLKSAEKLSRKLVAIFKSIIPDIEEGLDAYSGNWYMDNYQVDHLGDINLLKEKIEFYIEANSVYSINKTPEKSINVNTDINNNNGISNSGNSTNTITNTWNSSIDINAELNRIREEVEADEVLGEEDKEEINERLNEIENVMSESNSNNEKWKKMKSVISWITTKGYKVGKLIMPLITNVLFQES